MFVVVVTMVLWCGRWMVTTKDGGILSSAFQKVSESRSMTKSVNENRTVRIELTRGHHQDITPNPTCCFSKIDL